MDWHTHIQKMRPYVVKITTPDVAGTGFIIRTKDNIVQVITAAHVVRDAYAWRQCVTVHHPSFADGLIRLRPTEDNRIALHSSQDSACLGFVTPELVGSNFPREPIELVPPDKVIKEGVEVGWLGYPNLAPENTLCFFSGHVSACLNEKYFIDGVAIAGVSGGPAFYSDNSLPSRLRILGSVTAYRPSRKSGGDLYPGLMIADNASWAYGLQGW